jgi:hypothetical protein
MFHPFEFTPQAARKPLFYTFLALTLILFVIFRFLDGPLRTSAAPNGIVSYELAGSPAAAGAVLDSWDGRGRLFAAFGLGLDYLFMPAYALALALAVLLAAGRHPGWFQSLGALAGWSALAAAVFDAFENHALWRVLAGELSSPFPEMAAICATLKFTLLLTGLTYGLIGWIWPKK